MCCGPLFFIEYRFWTKPLVSLVVVIVVIIWVSSTVNTDNINSILTKVTYALCEVLASHCDYPVVESVSCDEHCLLDIKFGVLFDNCTNSLYGKAGLNIVCDDTYNFPHRSYWLNEVSNWNDLRYKFWRVSQFDNVPLCGQPCDMCEPW